MLASKCSSQRNAIVVFMLMVWLSCHARAAVEVEPGVFLVGSIAHPALTESSGLTRSSRHPGVLWTHNDTGSPAFLFAMRENGEHIGAYEVQGARPIDWEAITTDNGALYLADTGTNGLARTHSAIHKLEEPSIDRPWGPALVTQTWYVRFPGEREDCEGFFILGGYAYLVGKYPLRGSVPLYRFDLKDDSESILLQKVAELRVSDSVSDAALSPDGNRLALVTGDGVTVIFIGGNPASVRTALSRTVDFNNDSIEGSTFVSNGVLTSAEGVPDLLLFSDPLLEGVPVITTPLENVTAFTGDDLVLRVVAAGFPVPTYQWRFNGAPLAGQTNAELSLTNLTLSQSGVYEVTASNAAGSAVSSATITVLERVLDLRITEVMSSENPNDLPTADWWELTSFEDETVDLSGWKFNDSLGGLNDAFVLPPGIAIRPGESIVFIEDLTSREFLDWWGASNFAPDVQIITYSGSALSFRAAGDSVRLWDDETTDENKLVARVDFGQADEGVSFGYNPETEQFGLPSQPGVFGAFIASSGGDIGSPGRIRNTEIRLGLEVTKETIEITTAEPPDNYILEESKDLFNWNPAQTNRITADDAAAFFRLRKR